MFNQDVELALASIQAEVELMWESLESGNLSQADVESGLRFIQQQTKLIRQATRLQSRVEESAAA